MRLFRGQVPLIAGQIVDVLTKVEPDIGSADMEVHSGDEVKLDLEAVFKEFIRTDRAVSEEARDILDRDGLSRSMLGRTMARVAKEKNFPTQDDRLPYLVEQVMTMLFHSNNVDDIFAEDHVMRKKITTVLRSHAGMEDELDVEVRAKIKNLEEGTASFDIEYQRVMGQIKGRKNVDD